MVTASRIDMIAICVAALLLSAGAAAQTVTIQAGRTLTANDGTAQYYNATFETSITTQYIDTWNYQNGITYFWGSNAPDYTFTIADNNTNNPQEKYRTLLRFNAIDKFVPSTAVLQSAELTVMFINWNQPVRMEACFLNTPWAHVSGPSYRSTGWRYARWNGSASLPWAQPGGWADCSPDVLLSFVVPGNGAYGFVSQTLSLDAAKVAGWLANSGSANNGLLFRAVNGSLSFVTSQWRKDTPALRRPALTLTYAAGAAASPPPAAPYPLTLGSVPRVWWVDPAGDDEANSGHSDSPFKSPAKAVFEAWPGDSIYFKTGVYPGAIDVSRPRITLRSAPGHWAVLSLPMDDPQGAVNVITLRPGADYGVIQDLEIVGGFYYGIMFFTSWENYASMADRVAKGAAPSHWLIRNVRIHDTGSSAVKLVMKATNVTFQSCEFHNTGARLRTGGHGIEAVQAYDIVVRDCYLHDIPGAAVHLAGGTARALLERNYVAATNFGFNLGFATEYEYMDPINNPALHESINATARNNIIAAVRQAGVNVWASRGALLAHNTIWQAQEAAQSCVLVAAYSHDYTPAGAVLTSCWGLTLWGNVLVRSAAARAGPVLQIRAKGLDPASPFLSAHNVYYDQRGLGPVPFQWGKGAMLEDERSGSTFVGNATGWSRHCAATLGQPYCDVNSIEADPLLGPSFAPLTGCSPAVGRAAPTLPSGVALVSDDFHGRPRSGGGGGGCGCGVVGSGSVGFDAGAVQAGAPGGERALPPVPAAFAGRPPYGGVGLGPVYDKGWPYSYWLGRVCKDLYVDAASGNDNQQFNYNSTYAAPFKSVQAALTNANMCDRILLRGGQNHTGGFGIYKPNITITTNPADLPGKRATVLCAAASGDSPCIRTGSGLYGGAAALNLSSFDVAMEPGRGAAGSCVHLNEGAGGAASAYWAFYLAASGKAATAANATYISDMALVSCGLHGIKLSTFVRGVVMQRLNISGARGTGIEVRGGGDLVIQSNRILGPAGTGIRLGGGARNLLVQRNLVRGYGDRGILLGSDVTEVMYMDVDWARSQAPAPDWHDCVNATVRNNVIDGGAGAGLAFYSARDVVAVHNTLLGVAASMQAGVLLSVSLKQLGPSQETGAPNTNITLRNNVIVLAGPVNATANGTANGGAAASTGSNLMVEARVVQGSLLNRQLAVNPPNGTCPAAGHHHHHHHRRRRFRNRRSLLFAPSSGGVGSAADEAAGASRRRRRGRRALQQQQPLPFAAAYMNTPGEQGRNTDGSCPLLPADNAWRRDVSGLPVRPNSDAIRMRIGGGNLHADFGGGITVNGQRVLYGIPFTTVDSSRGTSLVQVDFGPSGYPAESDTSPAGFPIPASAPVEGAYAGCPDVPCGGDRHVLVVDNATCLLYETWRSFPPAVTATGRWRVDILARFNLSRNAPGRPLGWTSADAAGLPILPGLVRWDEVVTKGVIDHAIRFTGPNSRRAYVPPATHYAPAGYTGPDAPPMGLRVRLRASFDCSPLQPAARVFCVALQKYGGIFADNGSPWYFTGEATSKWDSVLSQLGDISKIPASAMEVLDSGCLCLDAGCTMAECGGVAKVDPNALPVYPAITNTSGLSFANNIYFRPASTATGATTRYVDRRMPPLGAGYDGGLAGWQAYVGGDAGSIEADPGVDAVTYRPRAGGPAVGKVPRLAAAAEDYYGAARGAVGGWTDAGAALAAVPPA